MMATTHALVGVLVGLALVPLAPEAGTAVVLAGAAGGVLPDLDAVRGHRRALHLPVLGTAVGLLLASFAAVAGNAWLVALAAGVLAAGLHAASDVLDGGLSLRPWAERPERGVYCHVQGRWWRPWRVIAYDGSPADLGLAALLALPAIYVAESTIIGWLAGTLLALSIGYAVFRKRVPAVLESLGDRLESRLGVRPVRRD